MKLTLTTKLAIGFGIIIALIAVTTVLTLQRTTQINQAKSSLIEHRFATVNASKELLNGLNASIASLRGYLILGSQSDKAEHFKKRRASAWQAIQQSQQQLSQLSNQPNQQDQQLNDHLSQLNPLMTELQQWQDKIEAISHTEENIPAITLLLNDAGPFAETALDQLSILIDEEDQQIATPKRKHLLKLFADSHSSLSNSISSIRDFVITSDNDFAEKYQENWKKNQVRLEQLKEMTYLFTDTESRIWKLYLEMRQMFAPLPEEIIKRRKAKDWNKANHLMATEAVPRVEQITEAVNAIIQQQNQLTQQDSNLLGKAIEEISLTVITASIAVLIVSILIGLVLSKQLVNVLKPLNRKASEIAEGNLSGKLLPVHTKDEIGRLTNSINQMAKQLRQLVEQMNSTTQDVNQGTAQLTSANKQIVDSMLHQNEKITTIASAVDQLSTSANQIAQNTAEASHHAQDSANIANEGGEKLTATIATINEIQQSVLSSNRAVENLNARSEEIGRVTEVISAIAEQTGLLALNAAIEAARAGEQGRGFAVVADEVRQLAQRTSTSTEEITQSIQSIQLETSEAVKLMANGIKLVEQGTENAQATGQSIKEVVDHVNDVASMIISIATATEQQSNVIHEIASTIEEVSQLIQLATDQTQNNAQATTQLLDKASQLDEQVKRFKV
ncbi:methyl-accepting chemotaxis protein [Spartinivicinus poritis]|uniref:Methyl-accepting chemotaxis protein n=1 Tax=Spartinivicinus poritis TaxID=2994640 RepID=A0ABT5UDH0_9GAMM|nr:methyl-accepting chemotaxis protein [Spartinivicinus sp. A2-2]MDE1463124.1 methyl-accepting chemotaxis protein [Spartinivicinus sp. A2-2]